MSRERRANTGSRCSPRFVADDRNRAAQASGGDGIIEHVEIAL
jgi:hypothetical protein